MYIKAGQKEEQLNTDDVGILRDGLSYWLAAKYLLQTFSIPSLPSHSPFGKREFAMLKSGRGWRQKGSANNAELWEYFFYGINAIVIRASPSALQVMLFNSPVADVYPLNMVFTLPLGKHCPCNYCCIYNSRFGNALLQAVKLKKRISLMHLKPGRIL